MASSQSILNFNGKWRSYQQRILDSLDFHLRDRKLHIVAAPGAGKTTLGIEVISRIGRPTLILCPTNTIKNQWRDRICSSFLQEKDYGLVSVDIRKPARLTVSTYQALLAALCGREDECGMAETESGQWKEESGGEHFQFSNELISILKSAGVSLLCFDEAHHLRNEWWKALTYLNEHLQPEQTLALTATPPYDADYNEWNRYQELCGEIDEVISIPELVKNGDLCPHQDYICFSSLKGHEQELADEYSRNVKSFVESIQNDGALLEALSKMRFFKAGDSDIEKIFESPEFYVSIASLLNSKGYRIPKSFLTLFDARQGELPPFDLKQASVFINGFLESEDESFATLEGKRTAYHNEARRLGLASGARKAGKVALYDSAKIRKLIAGSLGKLDSIVQIVQREATELQESLRMVILTDYIKMDDTDCRSIGVVPIWRKLTAECGGMRNVSIGVLCGTLVLLPESARGKLFKLLADNGMPEDAVTVGRFGDEQGYIRVTPKESLRNNIVSIVTEMFCAGDLTVLIGTQALLGEGWDAPAINSLILSSTVSSYMLSNQMRGRAIRVDRNNPGKVSNIWHLATIDPSDHSDLDQLATRFKGFEAPSYHGNHEITSGIERVHLPHSGLDPESPCKRSSISCKPDSFPREEIRRWWKEGLYSGNGHGNPTALATGTKVSQAVATPLVYKGYLYRVISFLSAVVALNWYLASQNAKLLPFMLAVSLLVSSVYLGVITVKHLRTGTVERVIKQMALAVLETLYCQGTIKTSVKKAGLRITDSDGMLFVSCTGLPAQENNLFIQSLQELLDPIDNPRYLLVRHSTFMGKVRQTDYFAVPALLSANKKSVDLFRQLWEKHIGKCETVYTRNAAGRRLLLKARKAASSAMQRKKSQRLSKWQ